MRKTCLLLLLAAILTGSVGMVAHREYTLARSAEARLQRAPRDPRARMTGDYMDLEYQVNNEIARELFSFRENAASLPVPHRAVLRLTCKKTPAGEDIPNVLDFVRLDDGSPLQDGEIFLAFRTRDGRVVSAATAFHFQEGQGEAYEQARYGRLRISPSGTSLLTDFCDEEGGVIRPE